MIIATDQKSFWDIFKKRLIMLESSSPINLRPMNPNEAGQVLALIHHSIRELNSKDYSPQQVKQIINMYNEDLLREGNVIIAELGMQLVGIAKLSSSSYGNDKAIDAVFVHPDFLRQGIGRQLVQELEKIECTENTRNLWVFSSLTAIDFYKALKYTKIKKTLTYQNIPCILFKKQIKPLTVIEQIFRIFLLILLVFMVFSIIWDIWQLIESLLS